jgi:hypothetical protein
LFVCVSVQVPAQAVPPPVQVHMPFVQAWPAAHWLPQVPQFVVSVALTHAPLQLTNPAGHVHIPATHELPEPHGVPHAPQFALSVAVSTQPLGHCVCPSAHVEPPPDPAVMEEPPVPANPEPPCPVPPPD